MTVKLILARNMKEAHAFARGELGLSSGQFRVVNHADTLRSVRNADLYMVPGHDKRHDRFAIKSALRYTRLNIIDVAAGEHLADGTPASLVEAVKDDLIPAGEQMTVAPITEDEASAFLAAPPVEETKPGLSPEDIAEMEKNLEPLGFELSTDPVVQAEQILESAAHFGEIALAEEAVADRTTLMQELSDEAAATEEPAPAPAQPEVKRRRRKCKECGEMHFKEEPCATPAGAE